MSDPPGRALAESLEPNYALNCTKFEGWSSLAKIHRFTDDAIQGLHPAAHALKREIYDKCGPHLDANSCDHDTEPVPSIQSLCTFSRNHI